MEAPAMLSRAASWIAVSLTAFAVSMPAAAGFDEAAGDDAATSLAVLRIDADGVSDAVARFVLRAVAQTATDSGAFRVISSEEILALLELESQQQLCGVESESCLADIGGALGTEYLATGAVTRTGERLVLSLLLIHVPDARRVAAVQEAVDGGESGLIDAVPRATIRLLAPALEGRQGDLFLSVTEPGATVRIDGRIVGVTPLPAVSIAAGMHLVEVEKEGFLMHREQVRVRAEGTTTRVVTLLPSPDYLSAYHQRASRMRLGAWLATGTAAAGAAGALVFNRRAEEAYQEFQPLRRSLTSGEWNDADYERLTELSARGRAAESAAYVSVGVAGAAAVTAAYFWIAGDDPARYRHLQVAVDARPASPGVGVAWRF